MTAEESERIANRDEKFAFDYELIQEIENNQDNDPVGDFDDDQDNFQQCSSCDGHDACRDFGCAFRLGLGDMVERDDLEHSL
jgi:hypothetical protein